MSATVQPPGYGLEFQSDAYWTGKDINATDGSRNVDNSDLLVGDVLQFDPYNFESKGRNYSVGRPTSGILTGICVVSNLNRDVNTITNTGTGQRQGGTVKVVTQSRRVTAKVRIAATTNQAAGALLAVDTTGRRLVVCTASTVAHLLAGNAGANSRPVGVLLQGYDNSGSGSASDQYLDIQLGILPAHI